MKYYAVIDTNVLVSAALKWKSVPGSIVDLAFNEVIVPLVNKEILEEYRSVLLRPKFHLTEEIVQDIIDEFVSHALDISEEHLENIKHFPIKPYVVTPRQMLDIILNATNDHE